MADIFKPYNGKNFIKVDGVCYQFAEFDAEASESVGTIEGEYDQMSDCFLSIEDGDSSSESSLSSESSPSSESSQSSGSSESSQSSISSES